MDFVTQIIEEGDFCALGLVILILCAIGQKMTQHQPSQQIWGLRLAAVVFVGFTILRIVNDGAATASTLLSSVIRGLVTAGLFLGPAWIVLAIVGFLLGYWTKFEATARARAESRRRDREEKARSRERERQSRELVRSSPQRENELRAAEARRVAEAQARVQTSQRREDARLACEVLYNLRAPDIAERFSREQLAEFMAKYMADDKPVDIVERRAGELQQLIQQHFEAVNPPDKFHSLAELTRWYEEQQKLIGSLPSTDLYKDHFLVRLNERFSELSERMMERL